MEGGRDQGMVPNRDISGAKTQEARKRGIGILHEARDD
jgi:hypothetical protein